MLAKAQEARQILDEEQLAFLANPGILEGQAVQKIIPNNAAFHTKDLDTYDSDCDDVLNAKAVFMANISNYGSDVISEIRHSETYLNDMENQKQMINHVNNGEKANKDHNNKSVTVELERYKECVKTFEQRLNIDLSSHEKMIDSQMDDMIKEKLALKEQVDSLEQNLYNQIKEKECLLQTFTIFKSESKEKEDKYMENEIDLEKKIKELDNIIFKKAQRIKPTLYDGIVISNKHVAMPVIDEEETLILEEVSQSKMSEKEKDPEAIKRKISNKPIDFVKLNKLYEAFGKRFVSQQELSADEAFWYHMLNPSTKSSVALPVKIEASKELPKTTPNAQTEDEWGFKHTKAVFNNEIIPFLKSLKDIFNVFDKDLLNEIMEVQTVFDQIDAAVQQSSVDKKCLVIYKKELLLEIDRHLQQSMSQYILLTVMNSMSLIGESVNMERKQNESCDKCFNLNVELLKSQNAHNDLLKSVAKLLLENERLCKEINHVKQLFKEQFDSIKKTRVCTKE
nr:hypothetical protein [Tanacetum cinerariifolium]